MTCKIEIPFKTIKPLASGSLDLTNPKRCSRCNLSDAPYFETHILKYRGGIRPKQTFSRKFIHSISFRLRLPLCEKCYQKNFTEAPETMTRDAGPLAVAARYRSAGILSGSLIACVAFILLMKVVPLPATLTGINYLWLYPIALAALILCITYDLNWLKNRQIERELKTNNYDLQLHRAAVSARTQFEKPVDEDVAVVIELENDGWADECADFYGWISSASETQTEKDSQK